MIVMTRRRAVLTLTGIALSLLVGGARAEDASEAKDGKLVIFAAASLQDVFAEMGKVFETAHPGVVVTFNFAGTQELRTQLEQGAHVDVFASADQKHMSELLKASRVVGPSSSRATSP